MGTWIWKLKHTKITGLLQHYGDFFLFDAGQELTHD